MGLFSEMFNILGVCYPKYTQKMWKIGLYFKNFFLEMSTFFLQKYPLDMGMGFEAHVAKPYPNQIWVPPGIKNNETFSFTPFRHTPKTCCKSS